MAQYKDSLFRTWFNNKEGALELYNALHNTNYDETAELIINTLSETLWTARKNDISFLLNRKLVLMGEHQSTINENMPYRFLDTINRIFEQQIPNKKKVYQKKLIKLPRPEFVVIYNGPVPYPEHTVIRLSDAFERVEGFDEIAMDLSVKVYNLNGGYNEPIKDNSERMKGYGFFVDRMRYHEAEERKRGTPPDGITLTAIRKTIVDNKDANLMKAFWEKTEEEDIRMLCTEWDQELAVEVSREEGFEAGREAGRGEGRKEGIRETAREMKHGGLSVAQIGAFTGLSFDEIKSL